jgi:hypothetical protein
MKRLQGFIIGFVVSCILLLNVSVFAESINVLFNVVNIKINGVQVAKIGDSYTLSNGEKVPFSISYKGTTYLPMRKLAELLGKEVTWDGKTNTASVNDKVENPTTESKSTTNNKPLEVSMLRLVKFNSNEIQGYETGITENIIGTPELNLVVLNKSGKDIDAFEFECKLYDTFDRPVNKVGSKSNVFRGIAQNILLKSDGETYGADYPWDVFTWNLTLYENATKVKDIKILKVHFTDGSVWISE